MELYSVLNLKLFFALLHASLPCSANQCKVTANDCKRKTFF